MKPFLSILTVLFVSILTVHADQGKAKEKTEPAQQKEKQPIAIATHGTPEIDGEVDEAWKQARKVEVNKPVESVTDIPADQMATATVQLMWDEGHLYALWLVTDSKLAAGGADDWDQDSVEWFIDERGERAGSFQSDDAQYRVNYEGKISGQGPGYNQDNLRAAAKKTDDGYLVEMALNLEFAKGEAGEKLGLELQVNDDPGDGYRRAIAKWNHAEDDSWEDTSNFGTLRLRKAADQGKKVKKQIK